MYNPYGYAPNQQQQQPNNYYNQQQPNNQQQQQPPSSSFGYQQQTQNQLQQQQPQYYGGVQQQSIYDPYGGQSQQMNSYYPSPSSNGQTMMGGSQPHYANQPYSSQPQQPYANQQYPPHAQPYGNVQQPQPTTQQSFATSSVPPTTTQQYPSQSQQPPYGTIPQSYNQPQTQSPPYGTMPQQGGVYNQQQYPSQPQQPYGCVPSQGVVDQQPQIPQQYAFLQNYEQYYAQQKIQQPLQEPFVDPDFPPNETSLGHSKKKIKENNYGGFKRASELCENPQLIVDGIDVNDIAQGSFGDCWLLSSLAAVARYPHLIAHLFVKVNVSMGQYTLRLFWRNEWKYVTVDDYVPITTEDEPMVVRSKNSNELWPTIVEKAIAKLFGSYAKVEGGDGTLGIYLFTGCLPQFEYLKNHVSCLEEEEEGDEEEEEEEAEEEECEDVEEAEVIGGGLCRDEIWHCIVNGFNNGNAIGFGSEDTSGLGDEFVTNDGIVGGHYYALVDCMDYKGCQLVRLRNPWGNTEWTGAWSDVSKEMTAQARRDLNERFTEQFNLVQQLCRNTGLIPVNDSASDRKSRKQKSKEEQDDGVFWMSLDDVITHFGTMTIGHITNIEYLFKEENAFGFRFDQNILRSIHKSSTFPIFKQILKHDDKDHVSEDESGCKVLTQQFNLTVDRECDALIALRMIHNDMLKYNSYLELVCEELDIKSDGLYVFAGTRRNIPKGQFTFHVNSESRNGKFSDVEVTLLWENRQAHISLNEQEVEFTEYEEYEE